MKMKPIFRLAMIGIFCCALHFGFADIIRSEGEGFLELLQGQQVLHVKGSPYDMGFQHGKILKEQIRRNISKYIDKDRADFNRRTEMFKENLPRMLSFTPKKYLEEMRGIAEGAEVPLEKVVILNLFPELFHCSGITVAQDATKTGELYHVRVLDYAIGKNLQETAVLILAEPDGGIAFLNVSYAGFVGCVTGMNAYKIAIGEIGGQGYGYWEGVPMAFLMREVLEKSMTLEEAKSLLSESARTCEYFYVISDGKTGDSCGVYATMSQIHFVKPGASYALLAPKYLPKNYGECGDDDKFFLSQYWVKSSFSQTLVYNGSEELIAYFREQPKHCILMTGGFSGPMRYTLLAERVQKEYGKIEPKTLQEIIKAPVAHPSNLHNAIFSPGELKIWVAQAGPGDEPACDQPYFEFDFLELLRHH